MLSRAQETRVREVLYSAIGCPQASRMLGSRTPWTGSCEGPTLATCPSSSPRSSNWSSTSRRQGPRPDDPAGAPAAGGSGDRVVGQKKGNECHVGVHQRRKRTAPTRGGEVQ
jgi:hypothetical protein